MKFFTLSYRRLSASAAIVAAAVTLLLPAADRAAAADWPNWRGPKHNGVSGEKGWFEAWLKEEPKVLWEKTVGAGYSSVAVVGGRVYTMGNDSRNDTVWCLNADTGKEVWKHTYPCRQGSYKGPRATPTVAGKSVYTISRAGHVFCLDAASGKERWRKKLSAGLPTWGFAGSPLVAGKLVILNVGGAGVALDKKTGNIVWKSSAGKAGYATPVTFELDGRKCAAIFSGTHLEIVNIASGESVSRHYCKNQHLVNAADPIISGDKVFISSGYGVGCTLLKIGGGKLSVLWRNKKMANQFSSCVLWKGHLYGFDWSNRFKCLDFATSEVKWSQKGFGRQSSLMIADGKMVIMEQRGTLVIAEPSPNGYKELAKKKVLSGTCWTVPVLADGRIYCRSYQGKLLCLKVAPKPSRAKLPPVKKAPEPTEANPAAGKLLETVK